MNLQETIQALEAKGILVALNLGQHQYCLIDSNCPVAVELRRIISDTAITLPELLGGYQAVAVPDPVSYNLPKFDGKVTIEVAGEKLQLNLDNVIESQLKLVVRKKLRELEFQKLRIEEIAGGLYRAYLDKIQAVKNNYTLPQLDFSGEELILTNCLITREGKNYVFIFPVVYKPEYVIRNSIRYKISDSDIEEITYKVYLKLVIAVNGSFLSATLLNSQGRKFQHYHGNDTDCWGRVTLPKTWDRTLTSLHRLATNLMKALATINRDSIMVSHPLSMPDIGSVLDRSTRLGREGEFEVRTEEAGEDAEAAPGWGGETTQGWGEARRRVGGAEVRR